MSDYPRPPLGGLVAAAFTPMDAGGELDLGRVPAVCEFVLGQGADALFLCGTTGEGASLSVSERKAVAEAYLAAASGRAPCVVHVGHDSLAEARELARHAEGLGADAIAMVPPAYFPGGSVAAVADSLTDVAAAAPRTPLFYYHIPAITGVRLRAADLLAEMDGAAATFAGVKFSTLDLDDLSRCVRHGDGRYRLLYGSDETLLAGLAMGAHGAVGSTYNFLGPQFRAVLDAFARGDLAAARARQGEATDLIHAILRYGGHPALKAAMGILGVDCGPPRLPLRPLSEEAAAELARAIDGPS
ncbi:MAG: dihydrodipicolinate synthase family protein [Planctomycetota bacterium]|jgi:N-acetylneuraminate lyase|nr:dihydrodipicolinate synthase family protein [Planctomycetota bacterium]MDP6761369.1 dihydrodipicolinate synthase family protein [Planctomycetota bacterium]